MGWTDRVPVWAICSEAQARARTTEGAIYWYTPHWQRWGMELVGIVAVAALVGLPLYFWELRGRGRVPWRIVVAVAIGLGVLAASRWRIPAWGEWYVDGSFPAVPAGLRWPKLADAVRGFGSSRTGQRNFEIVWSLQIAAQIGVLMFSAWLVTIAVRRSPRAPAPAGES